MEPRLDGGVIVRIDPWAELDFIPKHFSATSGQPGFGRLVDRVI